MNTSCLFGKSCSPQIGDVMPHCWMELLPGDLSIASVSIPGTHDSATFALQRPSLMSGLVTTWGQTQKWNFTEQLLAGIRFLDLRVKPGGQLFHGRIPCAVSLADALDACAKFLQHSPSEFVVVRVKDELRSSSSGAEVHRLVKQLAKHLPLLCCKSMPSVAEARGSMVVLQDWEGPDLSSRWGAQMCIQDIYKIDSVEAKWRKIRQHHKRVAQLPAQTLAVNFASANNFPSKSPMHFASSVNPALHKCFESLQGCSRLGIVVMDFPTPDLCLRILRANFHQEHLLDGDGYVSSSDSTCASQSDLDRAKGIETDRVRFQSCHV
eukprot:TRINITY_DN12846_c0_g1_i1.p1 TRINITY_DN12846_c0_g1~~TRINITY_DN12846_c0_g1_i1.p1  ORF type:complete len:323 (+),score=54.34 TRINITY_DN12846_c0_g1_i1:94-1062(+)